MVNPLKYYVTYYENSTNYISGVNAYEMSEYKPHYKNELVGEEKGSNNMSDVIYRGPAIIILDKSHGLFVHNVVKKICSFTWS